MLRPGALALALILGCTPLAWAGTDAPASVPAQGLLGVRIETGPEHVVISLDLAQQPVTDDLSDDAAFRLRLRGLVADPALLASQSIPDPVLKTLNWDASGSDPVLVVPWSYRLPVQVSTTSNRLTITLQKVFCERTERPVAHGVTYETQRRGTPSGPLFVHLLHVDPRVPGVRVAPALAQGSGHFGLEPVSRIAARNGAVAGVNGAYFGRGGQPLGLLMIGGRLVSGPVYARTALALGDVGKRPFIERAAMSASLELPGGQSVEADGVNQTRWGDQIVIYTEIYGDRTRTEASPGSFEAAVGPNGRVLMTGTNDLPIPVGGFVVSSAGNQAAWLQGLLRPDSQVAMKVPLTDYWEGATDILGAGPRLVERGLIRVSAEAERFQADVARGRAPRTSVGIPRDGELLIAAIDGRDASRSIGVTLPELAGLMQEFGAEDALNLDGGGSTTFVLQGQLMNKPSDGFERPVSNALLIWADPR